MNSKGSSFIVGYADEDWISRRTFLEEQRQWEAAQSREAEEVIGADVEVVYEDQWLLQEPSNRG